MTVVDTNWGNYDRSSYPVYELRGMKRDAIWEQFLRVEQAIVDVWSSVLGVHHSMLGSVEPYSDYNLEAYCLEE